MSTTPPPVHEVEFSNVETNDEDAIRIRFRGFLTALHGYLNQLPCMRSVQATRRRWKARVSNEDAFGTFATQPQHWYTFHHGGRNEAQFNVGLFPTYLRVGLGFEFSLKKGGDPTAVQLAYACFTSVIRENRRAFQQILTGNGMVVEWSDNRGSPLEIIPTHDVMQWLPSPPREPSWIFVGRHLRREVDARILDNSSALGTIMNSVLRGLRPIWEQTELLACIP